MLSPVNRLVHKSMWHILKSMFSKIQHLNLKMYSLLLLIVKREKDDGLINTVYYYFLYYMCVHV